MATMTKPADESLIRPAQTRQNSLVVAITGPRGSGKTLLMTYLAIIDMKRGRSVLANYNIGGRVRTGLVQSQPLNFENLLAMSESLQQCVACIDEINLWFDSTRWMTQGNKLLGILLQQMRKRSMSLYYTSQNFRWNENRLRWQTDLLVFCQDMCRTPEGMEQKLSPGEYIRISIMDLSGYLTGKPYDQSGEVTSAILESKPIWQYYDTYNVVDPWQAMSKVELKRPKLTVDIGGARKEQQEEEYEPMPSLAEIEEQVKQRWS
jgi:energy-coupling factor transporter ATP-binding protein EcfA2